MVTILLSPIPTSLQEKENVLKTLVAIGLVFVAIFGLTAASRPAGCLGECVGYADWTLLNGWQVHCPDGSECVGTQGTCSKINVNGVQKCRCVTENNPPATDDEGACSVIVTSGVPSCEALPGCASTTTFCKSTSVPFSYYSCSCVPEIQ